MFSNYRNLNYSFYGIFDRMQKSCGKKVISVFLAMVQESEHRAGRLMYSMPFTNGESAGWKGLQWKYL